MQNSTISEWIYTSAIVCIFAVLTLFTVRYLNQRRLQLQLQEEVRNIFFEYNSLPNYDDESTKTDGLKELFL